MQQEKLVYCLYARKSTESDERQALSIDSQIKEMEATATEQGLVIAEIKRESHSAKASGKRPEYNQLIEEIRDGRFNAILTWAPDRLSRNAGDLGSIVDLMDAGKLLEIRTPSQTFGNNPNEKFLLMILCSQAKLENDNRAKNVLRGMKTKCEMGWRPCRAPIGYVNQKYAPRGAQTIMIDPIRAPIVREMFEKCAYEGKTGRELMDYVNRVRHFRTENGREMTLSMVYNILSNTFYYGEFEYPLKSGKIYVGKHEPLITRELYNKVRERLLSPVKAPYGQKKFAYTGFLKCWHCGYGITASEKFKQRKDGSNTRRYVYYHCVNQNKGPGFRCRSYYLREDRLTKQILERLDELKLEEGRLGEKIVNEVRKFSAMQKAITGPAEQMVETSRESLLNYVRYVVSNGTVEEIREVMRYVENKLMVREGKLSLG